VNAEYERATQERSHGDKRIDDDNKLAAALEKEVSPFVSSCICVLVLTLLVERGHDC